MLRSSRRRSMGVVLFALATALAACGGGSTAPAFAITAAALPGDPPALGTPQPTTVVDSTTLRFTITPPPWEADAAVTGELAEADLNLEYPDFAYDFREIHTDIVTNHIGVDAAPLFPEPFTTTGDIHLIA
jgi:hypothetical protein